MASQEMESEALPNKNLRLGLGCMAFALVAFVIVVFLIQLVFGRERIETIWFMLTLLLIGLTATALLSAIELINQGIQGARLLKGEGVVTGWKFERERNGIIHEATFLLGKNGCYMDGAYKGWKKPRNLDRVVLEGDPERKLRIQWWRKSTGRPIPGHKNISIEIPVPEQAQEKAQQALEYLLAAKATR